LSPTTSTSSPVTNNEQPVYSTFPPRPPTTTDPFEPPSFTVPPVNTCSGAPAQTITFPPGNPPGGTYIWTNNNTSIGIPANGTGNIPSFTPPISSTTQVATINVTYLCASTSFTITVLPSAGPDFNFVNMFHNGQNGADPLIQCLGDSTSFQAQASPGVTIQSVLWNFGDGTTSTDMNPVHLFQNNGNYTVSLEVTTTDGCTQTSTSTITINPKPVASYTSTPECEYDAVNFNSTSTISLGTISSWNWSFGDGAIGNTASPSHLYPADGNYPVGLLVVSSAGCRDSVTGTQIVYEEPIASFTKTEECENSATSFTDYSVASVGISSWDWDYQNDGTIDNTTQSPSYTYPSFGTYSVELTVTDANGCVDDTVTNVIVNPLPVAAFAFTTVCPNFATDLTDASTVGGGNSIAQWSWDLGNNGSIETNTQNGANTWATGGLYPVELMVESVEGCRDSVVNQISVYPKPEAAFSSTTVCFGTATDFTDNSIVALNNTFATWEWDFDDGNSSNNQSPSNTYNSHGLYDVTLMVETNNGCRDTITNQIEVYSLPIIDFSMQNECEYDSVSFINNTTIPSGEFMTYIWNFDDNSMLSIETPSHLYATEGIYAVQLEATSTNGCVNDSTISVEVYDEPSAQFSLVNGCVYDDFTFTDYTITTSTISSWEWDFYDGNTSTDQSPIHHFNSEGIYQVQLITTTTELCKDTNTMTLEVYPKPIAAFTPTDVCLNTPTEFLDISVVSTQVYPNETVLPYSGWDFGDGLTASGPSSIHTYNSPGSYNAQITITSNHGCRDTANMIVIVHSNPVASFVSADSAGCSPVTASFINTSTIDNNPQNYTLTYDWYFDNNTVDNIENTNSVFVNEGHTSNEYYGASLVATSNYGCKDSVYNNNMVTVYPIPYPEFSFNPDETNVYNTLIEFTDESIGASFWFWNLGDATLTNDQNPTHRYADSGYYVVDLRIENGYGCTDSISKTLRIDPVFEVFIPNSITPNADGINDVFMVDGYGISKQEMYIFDKWGQLLYEGFNVGDSWDGFVKGKIDKTAVYVYLVKIEDLFNKPHTYKGSVTVIR
jgi:gliding motility-associated-like protein